MMIKILLSICILAFSNSTVHAVGLNEFLLNKKAKNQIESMELEAAKESVSELLKESPNNPKYLHNLGQIYILEKQAAKAEKSYIQALKTLPKNLQTDTKLNLATAYLMQNKINEAKKILTEILIKDPSNKIAKNNYNVLLNLEKQEEKEQEQEQEEEEEEEEEEDNNNNDEQDEDDKDKDQQEDSQSSRDKELEDLRKKQAEEDQKKKEEAYAILNALAQREEEARQKYMQKQKSTGTSEYDW